MSNIEFVIPSKEHESKETEYIIEHFNNNEFDIYSGHIGYGVCPSERNRKRIYIYEWQNSTSLLGYEWE